MNSLENALCGMQSFKAVRNVLNGVTLHDLQCIDVMKMLAAEQSIVCYDTGTGKTLLAAAFMRLLWNEDSSRKFIMFVKKDQLIQTPEKLESACGRKVITSPADAKSLDALFQNSYSDFSVLMLTHECLLNNRIMNDLFRHREEYTGVIVDEAHEISHKSLAKGATVLAGLLTKFRYRVALTATPLTTNVLQLANLANMISPERFPDANKLYYALKNGKFDVIEEPCFFIERKRADFGGVCDYRGRIEWVEPLPHQKADLSGAQLFKVCKGEGAFPQAEALVKIVRDYQVQGKRGLIYVNQHAVREWLLPFLEDFSYACINGSTKSMERSSIMHSFNVEKTLDVVITSVTTAIDLDCDFVVFYEFTSSVKQMIGRAHRGLSDKSLDVIFLVTDDSGEVDYFLNNVLAHSKLLRDVLHKEITEMEGAEQCLASRYAKI